MNQPLNEEIYIDTPAGDDWSFSLDPNAPVESYSPERRFTADVQGKPFVDGKEYVVYAYHAPTNFQKSKTVTFESGPANCELDDPSRTPGLHKILSRSNQSDLDIRVRAVIVPVFPAITQAENLLAEQILGDGSRGTATYSIEQLTERLKKTFATIQVGGGSEGGGDNPATEVEYKLVRIWREVDDQAQTPPSAPSDLVAETVPNDGRDRLRWKDNSGDETGFNAVLSVDDGPFNTYISIGANQTVSGFLPGLNRFKKNAFKLQAYNNAGTSPYSNVAVLEPLPRNTPPLKPTVDNLSAVEGVPFSATLAPFVDANDTVEHGLNGLPAGLRFLPGPIAITGTPTSSGPFPLIYFAIDSIGQRSEVGLTLTVTGSLEKPTELTVTAINPKGFGLTWKDNTSRETQYELERATAEDGPYTVIKTVGSNVTSYTDADAPMNARQYYRVRARNTTTGQISPYSDPASALPVVRIERVEGRVIALDATTRQAQFRGITNLPDRLQWFVGINGPAEVWSYLELGAERQVYQLNYNTDMSIAFEFDVRPESNQTAVKGHYRTRIEGALTYDWVTIPPVTT